jgi:hypothetical protein
MHYDARRDAGWKLHALSTSDFVEIRKAIAFWSTLRALGRCLLEKSKASIRAFNLVFEGCIYDSEFQFVVGECGYASCRALF